MTIQKALKAKIEIGCNQTPEHNQTIYNTIKNLANAEVVTRTVGSITYKVTETTQQKLTDDQKALIADSGNLCFGYRLGKHGYIIINTD